MYVSSCIGSSRFQYERYERVLTKLNLTRLKTFRDRSVNVRMLCKFDLTRMNEALEIATSLPEPTAIPTSAVVNAFYRSVNNTISKIQQGMNRALTGASLIPSPTIATIQRLFRGLKPKNFCHFGGSRFIPTCWSQATFSAF